MDESDTFETFLEVSSDGIEWKPCPACNGRIVQVRKAKFECQDCFQEFIADEEDMK